MDKQKITVLFLGSLIHTELPIPDRIFPYEDEIHIGKAAKILLMRIPKPGRQLYHRIISETQNQPLKGFEVFYRNLRENSGRFGLLASNDGLLASSTDDILITPKEPIYTDLLVIRGNFTKISLCIYGYIIEEGTPSSMLMDIPIQSSSEMNLQISRNIFAEKSSQVRAISQDPVNNQLNLTFLDSWHEVTYDDDIHEPEIKTITNISEQLIFSFFPQNLNQQSFITQFRANVEQITLLLSKIFKSKHLGLYYPGSQSSSLSIQIPLSLTNLALKSLGLSFSDQFRALEILRLTLQLQKHAMFCVQKQGIVILKELFIDFNRPEIVVLSTFKGLILQVFISLAHWAFAVKFLVCKNDQLDYWKIIKTKQSQKRSQKKKSRSRSNEKKKQKKKNSDDSSEQQTNKRKRDKKKHKEKDQKKQKKKNREVHKKKQERQSPKFYSPLQKEIKQQESLSFYEACLVMMGADKNPKQTVLLQILIQQITQTITRSKQVSEQLAFTNSYLRDTKYIFNQSGQIINNKTLKTFAILQPFLNEIQSMGVDCEWICEEEKMKNMDKYGINLMSYRILNKINIQFASSLMKQDIELYKTPFNENFITMMSGLLHEPNNSPTVGFNRIIDAFKVDGIVQLKKHQAAFSIMSQYIYKVLLEDEGLNTILYIDQLHSSLIRISECLSQDPSLFSKELKRNIKQLSNYAMAYDSFAQTDGVFKNFCDYFLRIFKYQHYDISKIGDFKKKEADNVGVYGYENLMQNFSLGNFYQLFPNQPLLEVEVCLKIFIVVTSYNPNIWTVFYENKLTSGLLYLLNKIGALLIFFLSSKPQKYNSLIETKKYPLLVDNYLMVVKHILILITRKSQYEATFNQLMEEDIFQDSQLYQKCLDIYVTVYNAHSSISSMIYSERSLKKMKQIMAYITQIYNHLLQSYQLTLHQSRDCKIKKLLQNIYLMHYSNINIRAPLLHLLATIVRMSEGASVKLVGSFLLDDMFVLDKFMESTAWYIPNSERKIVQNIFWTNIFRSNTIIIQNLALLMRNLLCKSILQDKVLIIIEKVLEQLEDHLKIIDMSLQPTQSQIFLINKINLFTNFIVIIDYSFKNRINQKLLRMLKSFQVSKEKLVKDAFLYTESIKIKNNLLMYFRKCFCDQSDSNLLLTFLKIIDKILFQFSTLVGQQQNVNYQRNLESCILCIEVLVEASKDVFNQSIILYSEYLMKPYKLSSEINFIKLLDSLDESNVQKIYELSTCDQKNPAISIKCAKKIRFMVTNLVLFLMQLTTLDCHQFYSTESRRNAIINLVCEDKQFPFHRPTFSILAPEQLIEVLKQYFNFPIMQKPLQKNLELVESKKVKGNMFSKYVFSMIGQGEPVSKVRYEFIAGSWYGGDIKEGIYCPFRHRNYLQELNLHFKKPNIVPRYVYKSYQCVKQHIFCNQLFYLCIKKTKKQCGKKSSEAVIKLKKIPDIIKPIVVVKEQKKISPSPLSQKQSISLQKQFIKTTSPSPSKGINGTQNLQSEYNNAYRTNSQKTVNFPQKITHQNPQPLPQENIVQSTRSGINPQVLQHGYYSPPNPAYNRTPQLSGYQTVYINNGGNEPRYGYRLYPNQSQYPHNNLLENNYPVSIGNQYNRSNYNTYNPHGYYQQPSFPPKVSPYDYIVQQRLFNEANQLLYQIRSGKLTQQDLSMKRTRLQQILSSNETVHMRIKDHLNIKD